MQRVAQRVDPGYCEEVFPPVLGLEVYEVEVVLGAGRVGYLLAILVPAQPEESKPVLVQAPSSMTRPKVLSSRLSSAEANTRSRSRPSRYTPPSQPAGRCYVGVRYRTRCTLPTRL
jgi:hypothetical protein